MYLQYESSRLMSSHLFEYKTSWMDTKSNEVNFRECFLTWAANASQIQVMASSVSVSFRPSEKCLSMKTQIFCVVNESTYPDFFCHHDSHPLWSSAVSFNGRAKRYNKKKEGLILTELLLQL